VDSGWNCQLCQHCNNSNTTGTSSGAGTASLLEQMSYHPTFTCISAVCDVELHIFTLLVLCCDVRNNFRVRRCSVLLASNLISLGFMFCKTLFFIYLRILLSNTMSISEDFRVV